MGVDVTLNRHGSGLMNSQATDDNADIIEAGFTETLSRSNPSDNAMGQNLDMNGFDIINVGEVEGVGGAASEVSYDNSTSGLAATDVQAAIDETEARVDAIEASPPGAPPPDSITNVELANMPASTIKGNFLGSPADPQDMTPISVRSMLNVQDGATANPNAIETTASGEIFGLTEKVAPVGADVLLIEDSADSNNKKKVQITNLPGGGGGGSSISNGTTSVDIPVANSDIVFTFNGSENGRWDSTAFEVRGNSTSFTSINLYNDNNTSSTARGMLRFWHNNNLGGVVQSTRGGNFTVGAQEIADIRLMTMYQGSLFTSLIVSAEGKLSTGQELSPDCDGGGLTLRRLISGTGYLQTIKDNASSHGITDFLEADTFFGIEPITQNQGGLHAVAATQNDVSIRFDGYANTANTSDTGDGSIDLSAGLQSGTGATAYADGDNLLSVSNNGATKAVIKGNGDIVTQGGITLNGQANLRSYTVATLPSAAIAGGFIYVSDETGGAIPCFSDGTNWRRVTDRAIAA